MATENHIDIYVGSDVQPPSYLNVKDAPDHETVENNDVDFFFTPPSFVDGDFNAGGKNFFSSTTSESRFDLRTKTIDASNNGYVNIGVSVKDVTTTTLSREQCYKPFCFD